MSADIDTLIEKMQEQYKALRAAYQSNLIDIEKAFEAERSQILEANSKEINELFKLQKDTEAKCAEKRAEDEKDYARQLEDVRN
jgi:dynein regulatory complex protein 1